MLPTFGDVGSTGPGSLEKQGNWILFAASEKLNNNVMCAGSSRFDLELLTLGETRATEAWDRRLFLNPQPDSFHFHACFSFN